MSQGTMWSELDLCTMRIVVDNYMAALSEDKPFGKYTQIKVRPWFGGGVRTVDQIREGFDFPRRYSGDVGAIE